MEATDSLREVLQELGNFLRERKKRGLKRITLSRDSVETLRCLPHRLASQAKPVPGISATAPAAPAPAPSSLGVTPFSQAAPSPLASTPAARVPENDSKTEEPIVPAQNTPPPSRASEKLTPPEGPATAQIAWLRQKAAESPRCRELGTLRNAMVFSSGDPTSRLMLVGEAPGEEEEREGAPFVGPAGEKLIKILSAMGLSRETVYISNVVKYRPKMGDGRFQGAKNRPPTTEEVRACRPFLLAEIAVIKPAVIVALGATAAMGLLDLAECTVKHMRNRFHDLHGIPVMITFHPSYLLRCEGNPEELLEKRKVWEDMMLVMERLGMPISDQQRRYFLR